MNPQEPGAHPPHHPDDVKHYPKDAVIYRAGDPGHTMFVLIRGQVEVRQGERVMDVVQSGGIFGELGVIDPGQRSTSATAVGASDVLEIDEQQFLKLVQTTPFFALKLLRVLTARLRRQQHAQDAV